MSSIESSPTRLVPAVKGLSPSLKIRRFRLEVVEGPDQGRSCRPEEDRATVGKTAGADLVLTDRTVSRVHLEVAVVDEGFLLRDLGSTNGTYLEGYRVREVYLRNGARLGIGNTLLEFQIDDDDSDVELSPQHRFGPLVGTSAKMRRLFAQLARVAPTDATVLVEGETGTGKELVARAIHDHSERRDGPFVVVDAGSLPATLIESELFGHERGAFTGATTARAGAFEEADGGTVFLDELGELALELQPKLLRVLEQREVRRVGSNRTVSVDVRVVAATNRDLRSEINRGHFRSDLYYRLAVVPLSLPALRDRPGDVPLLAQAFLTELSAQAGRRFDLSAESEEKLKRLPWHGNVRELRNFIERSIWLSEGRELEVSALLDDQVQPAAGEESAAAPVDAPRVEVEMPYKEAKKRWTDHFDQVYLPALLERCEGNVSKASREAELDRAYLFRLLRRHNLRG